MLFFVLKFFFVYCTVHLFH
ncbi:hypothetical protein CAEBREN_28057 [Caenorhabditis brenneri]|uniref:Uncharacterized protein n=1 Tax=Caenorhabditis brenneri TaxID=135651 RepID=G0P5L7_CAEBE|nr:hypothetical protein CAEBREN_28057 [Caenorhabditis brenneri]